MADKKKSKAKPVKAKWVFDVFFAPRTSPLFLRVNVHDDWKKLQSHRQGPYQCDAFFRPTDISEVLTISKEGTTRKINQCFGEIHFCAQRLSIVVITHEVFHAVMQWAWEHGVMPLGNELSVKIVSGVERPTNEEMCAELIGDMAAEVFSGLRNQMGDKLFSKSITTR
jgi:hypothetical protein